jgi:hypothetical protein
MSTWDTKLVKDLFWEEVLNILATPVHTDREDTVAWHFDQKVFIFGQIGLPCAGG